MRQEHQQNKLDSFTNQQLLLLVMALMTGGLRKIWDRKMKSCGRHSGLSNFFQLLTVQLILLGDTVDKGNSLSRTIWLFIFYVLFQPLLKIKMHFTMNIIAEEYCQNYFYKRFFFFSKLLKCWSSLYLFITIISLIFWWSVILLTFAWFYGDLSHIYIVILMGSWDSISQRTLNIGNKIMKAGQ